MTVVVEIRNDVDSFDDARRRLADGGHIRRAMGDVLDESARLAAHSAELYVPKRKRRAMRAISSEHATLQPDGSLEAVAGVGPVDSEGLPESADEKYPVYVHEGTGLYGRFRRRITPVRAKRMVFVGRTGLLMRLTSTRGQRPQPFLGEAVEDVEAYLPQRLDLMVRRILDTDR